ncbi:MAG TPA: CBS domain-containing protein [Chitinophagaceae bacterium]|nr:CBS domain-containing protein [Chitinophagaceae bacterium]
MLAIELNNNIIPQLRLEDTVGKALQLINDFKVSHLPVVSEEKYLGLLSEEDLLDADNKKMLIQLLHGEFIDVSIKENEHFLQAVNISNEFQTSVVPVVNEENEFLGSISGQNLLRILGNFSGAQEIGGIIVLEMERSQFTISEISRIVESNEATILHLNTTIQPETGLLTVTIHINKKELSMVVAAFERYDYDVIYYFGEEKFENEIHSNYRHLMNYLDI